MGAERSLTSTQRSARRRETLRARGLKPHTFWLPDVSSAAFQEAARQDCEYLWRSVPDDVEVLAWMQSITDEMLADLDRAEQSR